MPRTRKHGQSATFSQKTWELMARRKKGPHLREGGVHVASPGAEDAHSYKNDSEYPSPGMASKEL